MSSESSPAAMVGVDASAGSSNNKRFRHFWEGPNSAAEQGGKEETKQGSPVSRLYQHALESVFSYLPLADLSHAVLVSRSWSQAVRVMPCCRFHIRCSLKHLVSACTSALSTHINSIALFAPEQCELSSDQLYILALRMPQLTELGCTITQAAANKVILPPKLQRLKLNLSKLAAAATVNTIINGVSQLPALTKLGLTLAAFLPAISFSPLSAVASLRDLELWSALRESQPTERHLDQLRALPQLRRMAVAGLRSESLARLVREPHKLRWQELHKVSPVSTTASAALSSLPSLTSLDTEWCSDIGFLAHLVQLRTLDLHIDHHPWPATITADAVVAGLSCCTQLTDLKITAPLNNKHLGTLLPRLPLLAKLSLDNLAELDSLACLSSGPLSQLRSLRLYMCYHAALHTSELKHVYALAALEELKLENSFVEPLTPLEQFLHTPPSLLLPKLRTFTYTAPFND